MEGFRGETTQICLEKEDMGGGESRKSSKVIRGDRLFACPPPPSPTSLAINNDRSHILDTQYMM